MEFTKIGVVGCGLMGHGIAQVAAQAGCDVVCAEADAGALQRGLARIEQSLARLAAKAVEKGERTETEASTWVTETRARIRGTASIDDLADRDLVIEAIVEDLDAKKRLFADLGSTCERTTALATNTSSLPVIEMATASGRPDRVVGLHFFNPVQLMKLVEVVRTELTAEEVFTAAHAFALRCGKTPISCRDTPGFVVNRLLVPFMVQAMAMLDRGDATAEDIDTGMTLGCGHPMGPLTLADYVGLDTTLRILEGWCQRYPDEPAFFVPKCLRDRVAAGDLGRKTGRGFYVWDGDKRV